MSRRLKSLGLVLLGVVAVGAMVASVASATTTDKLFVTGGGTASLHATKVEGTTTVFGVKTGGLEVKCTSETFTATASSEATSIELTPTYSGCTAEPLGAATVDVNGCKYRLTTTTTSVNNTSGGSPVNESTVDVICAAGVGIVITAPGCTITITGSGNGLNQNRHGFRYDNEGTGSTEDIKATMTLDNLHYETPGGFICSLAGLSTTGNDAYTTGQLTVKGTSGGSHVGIGVTEFAPPPPSFHSEASHTILVGDDTGAEEFVVNAGTAECTEAGYKGTMARKTPSEITLSPEYAGCTAFGFASTEVKPNGCAYKFYPGIIEGGKQEGSADIECPEGKTIEIVAKNRGLLKCTVTIGAQTGLKSVTHTNGGSGATRDVKVDLGLTSVKYTQDAGEGTGKCESGSFSNGQIKGAPTVIGENAEKKQVGFWVE